MRQKIYRRFLKTLIILSAVLGSSAGATLLNTTINISFDGGFVMYDPNGNPIAPEAGVLGSMSVNVSALQPQGPYAGTASMQGTQPFYGSNWTANGDITAYQNLLYGGAPSYCGSNFMCADANMNFNWNSNNIPVAASFGMNPNTSIDISDPTSILDAWANNTAVYFDVASIDTEGDGIPGTAMTSGPFTGFSPWFEGIATISSVCETTVLGVKTCTNMPIGLSDPALTFSGPTSWSECSPVPLPAAAWLFGSGLLGLVGFGRCKKS